MYYKSNIDYMKNFPFSLIPDFLGMENPDDMTMKKRYKEAMQKYRDEYQKAIDNGITEAELKMLGIERPAPVLLSSKGGVGGGLPFIPILSTGINLPPPTENEIRQVEMKIQAIDDAEEKKATPPEPPRTPNQPTRSQAPNAPLRPLPQSRLDEILDKYKENAG